MRSVELPGTPWVTELRSPSEEAVYRDVWVQNVYKLGRDQLLGSRVIDVGSNIGLFTAFALAHGAELVVAVDPVEAHHIRARAMIGPRPDVIALEASAGDGCGRFYGPGEGPDQTMVAMLPRTAETGVALPPVSRGVTLDELVGLALSRPGGPLIAKIDCEGCEYDLVASASDSSLQALSLITMEWHGQMGAVRECAADRLGEMLVRLHYTHAVSSFGDPNHGGMLHAHRND